MVFKSSFGFNVSSDSTKQSTRFYYCSEVLNGSIRTRRSAETLRPAFRPTKPASIQYLISSVPVLSICLSSGGGSFSTFLALPFLFKQNIKSEVRLKLLGVSNHGFVSILSEILNLLTNCETTILSYSPRISHYTVTIVLHLTFIHLSSYSNSGVFSTLGFCIGLRLSDY